MCCHCPVIDTLHAEIAVIGGELERMGIRKVTHPMILVRRFDGWMTALLKAQSEVLRRGSRLQRVIVRAEAVEMRLIKGGDWSKERLEAC